MGAFFEPYVFTGAGIVSVAFVDAGVFAAEAVFVGLPESPCAIVVKGAMVQSNSRIHPARLICRFWGPAFDARRGVSESRVLEFKLSPPKVFRRNRWPIVARNMSSVVHVLKRKVGREGKLPFPVGHPFEEARRAF